MKTLTTLPAAAALCFCLAPQALCQYGGSGGGDPTAPPPMTNQAPAPAPDGPGYAPDQPAVSAPPAEAPATPPVLEDVRVNFASVVKAFVDKHTVEGAWPLRDRETGKLRQLVLVSVKGEKAEDVGEGRYAAPAVLRDTANGNQELKAVFTANFTGSEWSVEKMRLLKQKPAKAKASAAPRATAPSGATPR